MFLTCSAGHFSSLEVFYDKNVTLKVKSVSEKSSRFKVLVSDTFKFFNAIFPKRKGRNESVTLSKLVYTDANIFSYIKIFFFKDKT